MEEIEDKYSALRLKNQLCFPIYLCAKEIARKYERVLAPLDLTYTQYLVMMCLWERSEVNVKDLGSCILLDPSTLTPLLKKLEQKGYLIRRRSEADNRNLILELTPAGEALRDAALTVSAELGRCLGLEPEEAAELYRLTCKALARVRQQDAGQQDAEKSGPV